MHNAIYKNKQLIVVTGSEILVYLVTVSGIYLQDLTIDQLLWILWDLH